MGTNRIPHGERSPLPPSTELLLTNFPPVYSSSLIEDLMIRRNKYINKRFE